LHPLGVKFGTDEGTFSPLLHVKFHPNRCSVSPLRGEKPQNRPLSKLNTDALRCVQRCWVNRKCRMITSSQTGDLWFFSEWRPPPPWILNISKFRLSARSKWLNCVIVPHFVAITQTVGEIWRFFDFVFPKWRRPPSWDCCACVWVQTTDEGHLVHYLQCAKFGSNRCSWRLRAPGSTVRRSWRPWCCPATGGRSRRE